MGQADDDFGGLGAQRTEKDLKGGWIGKCIAKSVRRERLEYLL